MTQFLVRQSPRTIERDSDRLLEECRRQRVSGVSPTYELIDALAVSIYLCAAFSFQILFYFFLFLFLVVVFAIQTSTNQFQFRFAQLLALAFCNTFISEREIVEVDKLNYL